jgi:hypothetical protein
MTTPFLALIPKAASPLLTALSAYSIYKSFPLELKVVKEKSPIK